MLVLMVIWLWQHQREVDSMKMLLQARSESEEISKERAQLDELKQHIQALKERGRGGAGAVAARAAGVYVCSCVCMCVCVCV
jgi:hypothetical protein